MQIKDNEVHNFHIRNILKKLEEKDLDAMLVANFNNIHYLSGYLSTSFAFMIIKENPIIFVSGMDMENAGNTSSIDIVKYESFDKMIEYLKAHVENLILVDGESVCKEVGSAKVLNITLLGAALGSGVLDISLADMETEIEKYVKKQFIEMNKKAFELGYNS